MENNRGSFIVKWIRRIAFIGGIGAVGYLANDGELGANTVTAISAVSPMALIVVTYMYEALAWILPKATVTIMLNWANKNIGKDNVTALKQMVKDTTPQALANEFIGAKQDIADMKQTLALIREDQLKNTEQ